MTVLINKLKKLWPSNIRSQLVWGVALVHLLMILILILGLSSCNSNSNKESNYEPAFATEEKNKKIILFGVPGPFFFESTKLIVNYLNKNLNGDATVRTIASTDFEDYLDKVNQKYYHFTIINGVKGLEAEKNGYKIVGKEGSDDNNRGYIVLRKDSDIQNFSDLKGKTISCPGPSALAGTMMPLLFLHKNGINLNTDIKQLHVPSFESCFMNIYLKKSAAGTVSKTAWNIFKQDRPDIASQLYVKWETPSVLNTAIIVRNDMDKELVNKIMNLLLNMHHSEEGRKALKKLEIETFEKANTETYAPIKNFMRDYNDATKL